MSLTLDEFSKKYIDDITNLGNHHHYGLLKETYEERGNNILAYSHKFLRENDNINEEVRNEIIRYQYWLVGFLSGQNFTIYPENSL